MEWLAAVLAFATTMLVFSMITTTIVETIHRLLGSRTAGLIMMLEHIYDDVIGTYFSNEEKLKQREQFIKRMILVRAPPALEDGFIAKLIRLIRNLWFRFNRASQTSHDLGVSQWRLLSHLSVESFMERLGASDFSGILAKRYADNPEQRDQVLKDIAQKFELYGQEAGIYFERKARTIAVSAAMIVAWIFYVHPYHLIQTYLQRPAVAVTVAELGEDLVEELDEIKKELPAVVAGDEPRNEIDELISDVKEQLAPLETNGAPIGWSKETGSCWDPEKEDLCWFNLPKANLDVFWLLLGGLLVGLGSPFWVSAVRQIAQIRNASAEIAKILKPEAQHGSARSQQMATPTVEKPLTTAAFEAAAAGVQASQRNEIPFETSDVK